MLFVLTALAREPGVAAAALSPAASRWLAYAILAALFLLLIFVLRFLFGPKGIARGSWESIQQASARRQAEKKTKPGSNP